MIESYDIVAIGSSPKIMMKVNQYAKENKSILVIDSSHSLGGSGKTCEFANYKYVEKGCFLIPYNKESYLYLQNEMNIPMKILNEQPFIYYKNRKYHFESFFLKALINFNHNKSLVNILKLIIYYFKDIKKRLSKERKIQYFEKGIKSLHDSYSKLIKNYDIKVKTNTTIESIYVDFENNNVTLTANNNSKLVAKKILIGTGINIKKIQSNKYNILIDKNSFISNYFSYLFIKIKSTNKIAFTYIDLTYHDNNKIKKEFLSKIDFYQAPQNKENTYKLLWRVNNITKYTENIEPDYYILCIDTHSWLAKKEYEFDMATEILTLLISIDIISETSQLIDYEWNGNETKTIGLLENTINKYYFPYIESTNSISLTANP